MGCVNAAHFEECAEAAETVRTIDLALCPYLTDADAASLALTLRNLKLPVGGMTLRTPMWRRPRAPLTGVGFKHLCNATSVSIREFDLSEPSIPNVDAAAIADALASLPNVEVLALRGPTMPSAVLARLASIKPRGCGARTLVLTDLAPPSSLTLDKSTARRHQQQKAPATFENQIPQLMLDVSRVCRRLEQLFVNDDDPCSAVTEDSGTATPWATLFARLLHCGVQYPALNRVCITSTLTDDAVMHLRLLCPRIHDIVHGEPLPVGVLRPCYGMGDVGTIDRPASAAVSALTGTQSDRLTRGTAATSRSNRSGGTTPHQASACHSRSQQDDRNDRPTSPAIRRLPKRADAAHVQPPRESFVAFQTPIQQCPLEPQPVADIVDHMPAWSSDECVSTESLNPLSTPPLRRAASPTSTSTGRPAISSTRRQCPCPSDSPPPSALSPAFNYRSGAAYAHCDQLAVVSFPDFELLAEDEEPPRPVAIDPSTAERCEEKRPQQTTNAPTSDAPQSQQATLLKPSEGTTEKKEGAVDSVERRCHSAPSRSGSVSTPFGCWSRSDPRTRGQIAMPVPAECVGLCTVPLAKAALRRGVPTSTAGERALFAFVTSWIDEVDPQSCHDELVHLD